MNHNHQNTYPWLMPSAEWCKQTGSNDETYQRLVRVAFRARDFGINDVGISEDARWVAMSERMFSNPRYA